MRFSKTNSVLKQTFKWLCKPIFIETKNSNSYITNILEVTIQKVMQTNIYWNKTFKQLYNQHLLKHSNGYEN